MNQHSNFLVRQVFGPWSFSTVFDAQNGRRYSIQDGGDPNNDGNSTTDRIPGFARNTATLPAQISMDIRLGHDFPIYERLKATFLFEAFNLFNRPNFRDVNPNGGQGLITFNLAKATALTATTNCAIGVACFFPVALPANPKDIFVGTYDQTGGGSPFPGPGPRTLQLAIKVTW